MSLTPLISYKTLSDKRLLEAFNEAMTAADANFSYTLGQVASPVPSLSGVAPNSVISVGQSGSSNVLEYKNPNELIDLQAVFTSYLNDSSKINLTDNLEFSVNTLNAPFSNFSITSRALGGAGSVNNYMRMTQLSTTGELEEKHVVSVFSLTSNSVSIASNIGFVEVNKLQVGNYKFPNTAGSQGQILRLGAANTLEFGTFTKDIEEDSNSYYFSKNKSLLLSGKGEDEVSLALYDLDSGIGTSPDSAIENQEIFFKFRNSRILTMTKPISPGPGTASSAYLKLESPIALPNAAAINTQTAHEGSIWYDSLNNSLVLVTAQGRLNIRGQTGVNSNLVNTEEAKVFNFNSASSIALGTGSNAAPALKIGNLGLTSAGQEVRFVFGATPALRITDTFLESAAQASGAAKVVFDNNLGINNPLSPVYTFSGATQLGLYRSATNAIGVAVQGQCVTEFAANGLDVKNKKVFNVSAPTSPLDAANKQYVDSLLPLGSVSSSIPIYSTASGKYIQSEMRYLAGALQLGSGAAPGAVVFKTVNSGSITLKAPSGTQNTVFTLPNNNLSGGILRVDDEGLTYWDSLTSVTSGLLKADGSVLVTGGIRAATATSKTSPLIGIDSVGMYAQAGGSPKLGFAANGEQLLEINANSKTITGVSPANRGPYIRLIAENEINPIYGFIQSQNSGLTYADSGVALVVNGVRKLTTNATNLSVHNQKVSNLAQPEANTDAATKEYVDTTSGLVEISFRVDQLPVGWSSAYALRLSLFDKAIIFNDSAVVLPFESDVDPATISIPTNFNTNAKCQCYINSNKLVKMPNAQGIRQVTRFNNSSLILNVFLQIGQIITVQLPGVSVIPPAPDPDEGDGGGSGGGFEEEVDPPDPDNSSED
jgi:hypothetical protein